MNFVTNSSSLSSTSYPMESQKEDLIEAINDFMEQANKRLTYEDNGDYHSTDHLEFLNDMVHDLRNIKTRMRNQGDID